jgi:hypothetical protein
MIYVINLERRPERLKEIIGELKREGLDRSFTLIRAIDGSKLPEGPYVCYGPGPSGAAGAARAMLRA